MNAVGDGWAGLAVKEMVKTLFLAQFGVFWVIRKYPLQAPSRDTAFWEGFLARRGQAGLLLSDEDSVDVVLATRRKPVKAVGIGIRFPFLWQLPRE